MNLLRIFKCHHVYRFYGAVEWYEPEYRAGFRYKWFCRECFKVALTKNKYPNLGGNK